MCIKKKKKLPCVGFEPTIKTFRVDKRSEEKKKHTKTTPKSYWIVCFSQEGEFDWNIQEQTLVLASYFYGYLVGNIPSAYLLNRFGIRAVFGVNGFASSLITILIPILARTNFGLLVAARIAVGFFQVSCGINICRCHICRFKRNSMLKTANLES